MALVVVVVPVAVLCCGKDDAPGANADGGSPTPTTTTTGTTTTPTPTSTTPVDAGPDARRSCLDRPNLPRPSDRLPCELIPPGLTL